jgi:hypothetical protein
VHLAEVHLWKICRQQWAHYPIAFSWKSYQGMFAFIFSVYMTDGKRGMGNAQLSVDAKEANP